MIASELPPNIFTTPVTASDYASVDATVTTHFGSLHIVQSRFYRPDGTITFSYLANQVGTSQRIDDSVADLREAFDGETSLDIRELAASDNVTGAALPTVLETYVPVMSNGQIIGVAEVYRDVADVVAAIRRMQVITTATVAAVALAMFVALGDTYRRSTNTIRAQARDLRVALELLEASYQGTLTALMAALDVRDHETEGHSERVAAYAVAIGQEFRLSEGALAELRQGALLHDLGKIGIPDAILAKPGPLNSDEWQNMQRHPELGVQMIAEIDFLRPALPVVHYHHERWDGGGYPEGLKAESIPLAARIFSVADSFDAITSNRPYRQGRPVDEARAVLAAAVGTQFDPNVIAAFLRIPLRVLSTIQSAEPAATQAVHQVQLSLPADDRDGENTTRASA